MQINMQFFVFSDQRSFQIRIGLHYGQVVAGTLGKI